MTFFIVGRQLIHINSFTFICVFYKQKKVASASTNNSNLKVSLEKELFLRTITPFPIKNLLLGKSTLGREDQ
jgi:hypothetical protein